MGSVVVVARKGDEIIDWEDFEEGSNLSPVAPDGGVLEHWCNQDELKLALNGWIEGRGHWGKIDPATPAQQAVCSPAAGLFTFPLNPSRTASLPPPAMLHLEFRFQTW